MHYPVTFIIMKLRLLHLGLLCTLGSSALFAKELSYIPPDFSQVQPVKLEIIQNDGPIGARFVKPTLEGVEIEVLQGDGSIGVGWQFMEQFKINKPLTESLDAALSETDPKKRAELLKEEIEPLLPLASIKPGIDKYSPSDQQLSKGSH